MQSISDLIREKNIELATTDPVARGGFTQVPNFILRDPGLSPGAKVVYAMFLSYAWHNESCFPGQERLAQDIGMSRSRVTEFISELSRAGLVTIQRRGQGRTNVYVVNFSVKSVIHRPQPDVGRPTPRSRPVHPHTSAG
jgi:biotin operon repressor